MSDHLDNHDAARHEETDLDLRTIGIITVASVVILIVSLVLLDDVFVLWVEEDKIAYDLSVESATRIEVSAVEVATLSSYGVVDTAKGVYQIPIDQAMSLVVDEASAK